MKREILCQYARFAKAFGFWNHYTELSSSSCIWFPELYNKNGKSLYIFWTHTNNHGLCV